MRGTGRKDHEAYKNSVGSEGPGDPFCHISCHHPLLGWLMEGGSSRVTPSWGVM